MRRDLKLNDILAHSTFHLRGCQCFKDTGQWCAQYNTARKMWYTLSQNKIKEGSISFKKLLLRDQWAETPSKPFNRISYTSCSTRPICSAADSSLTATPFKSSSQNRRESKDNDFKYNTDALFSKLAVTEIFTSIAPNFAVLFLPIFWSYSQKRLLIKHPPDIYFFTFYS